MAHQIFVSGSDIGMPTKTLTLIRHETLRHLKLSVLPPHLSPDSFFLTLNGRPLPDDTPAALLPPSAALSLRPRIRGGGGDGGATGAESRDCYLNMYATRKPDKADPNEARISKWTTCALSAEPLAPPCVMDALGNVFNKEPLVEALIHRSLPREFRHVRGLKDMIPIHLTPIPGAATAETRFHCPISGLEFNGKYAFLAIGGCGHVLSAKALKEVKGSSCLVCHREFQESDKIVVNGSADEVAALRARMESGREKKDKKLPVGGTKHELDKNGMKDVNGKRFKVTASVPKNATKEVYASIFTSSKKSDFKETYMCRSLPLGRN